jgi:hypothetical protein
MEMRQDQGGGMTWIVIPIALILSVSLAWLRNGHGGNFGEAIRRSDWYAWRDAVEDKERELSELKASEPKIKEGK